MTKYVMANMGEWVNKTKRRQQAVMESSIERLSEVMNLPRAKGGRMPVVTGTLRGSFQSSINGQFVGSGEPEVHVLIAVERAKPGDVLSFGWGGAAASYAARVNYGFTGTDSLGRKFNSLGAHFLDFGLARWPWIVREEVAKARASVGS